jgi:hypothetical protein
MLSNTPDRSMPVGMSRALAASLLNLVVQGHGEHLAYDADCSHQNPLSQHWLPTGTSYHYCATRGVSHHFCSRKTATTGGSLRGGSGTSSLLHARLVRYCSDRT